MEYNFVLCSTLESFYDRVGTPKPVFKTNTLQNKISNSLKHCLTCTALNSHKQKNTIVAVDIKAYPTT